MGKRKLTSLQPVDVLGIEAQEEPFVVQESQEIVGVVGSVVARVELLGQSEKGLRVDKEIGHFEDGFWVGDVVLLQIAVEAAPRGPAKRGERGWHSECRQRCHPPRSQTKARRSGQPGPCSSLVPEVVRRVQPQN